MTPKIQKVIVTKDLEDCHLSCIHEDYFVKFDLAWEDLKGINIYAKNKKYDSLSLLVYSLIYKTNMWKHLFSWGITNQNLLMDWKKTCTLVGS
jgi:hypothetical protein